VQHIFTMGFATVRQAHTVGVHTNELALDNLFSFEMVFGKISKRR